MASSMQLQPDEWVVMKSGPGVFHGRRPKPGFPKELVLTSKNLILVSTNMFGKQTGFQYFPLNGVKVIDGRPQVMMSIAPGLNLLELYFRRSQETFGLQSKAELRSWVDSISKLLTGRADEISDASDRSHSSTSQVVESVRDTVEAVKASFGLGLGQTAQTSPPVERAAGKCESCGAPISGIVGRVVKCRFCDSDQQMVASKGPAPRPADAPVGSSAPPDRDAEAAPRPPAPPAPASSSGPPPPPAPSAPLPPPPPPAPSAPLPPPPPARGGPISAVGWYADPWDAGRMRWWDGSGWTGHTSPPRSF